jgi:hypothetical protein
MENNGLLQPLVTKTERDDHARPLDLWLFPASRGSGYAI